MKNRISLQRFIPSGVFLTIILIFMSWSMIILLGQENPFKVFFYIVQGFLGDSESLFSTFNKMFVFLLTALAASIPAWTGMWNVGGDGQLILGGFAAAWLASLINTGVSIFNILIALLISALAGGLWALWPAWLRVRWNVNEVVTTLMGNYLITLFTTYMVNFPLRAEGSTWPRMEYIPGNYEINTIGNAGPSYTFIIGILILAAVEIIRRYCISGYEYQITGSNHVFSKQGGIHINKIRIQSMFIGGAFAGLAGGLLVLSLNKTFIAGFSPGYGNIGLLISLISSNMPLVILGIAFSFSALQVGAINMQLSTRIPAEITGVLQSIMVFFIAARKSLHFKVKAGGMDK